MRHSGILLGVPGGLHCPSLWEIGTKVRAVGLKTEKRVNFEHAHEMLGRPFR